MRTKLSSVISDLLGISGYRILRALAAGETDPTRLAAWGDERLHCSLEQLIDALTGNPLPLHRQLLGLYLGRYPMIADPIAKLNGMVAEAMKGHQEAVLRLAEVPGLGADSAQQVIAEVGVPASTFPPPPNLTSWVGTCPGKQESAEPNHSSRCAKGNRYMRRILKQAAHAAGKKNRSHFQTVFRRLAAPPGLRGSDLGHRPSPLPPGMEDPAGAGTIRGTRQRA
ncbi:MAG TPA: transposase [Terriglobales bacterium]|nr:transposase [Terriglobales bacterium]